MSSAPGRQSLAPSRLHRKRLGAGQHGEIEGGTGEVDDAHAAAVKCAFHFKAVLEDEWLEGLVGIGRACG